MSIPFNGSQRRSSAYFLYCIIWLVISICFSFASLAGLQLTAHCHPCNCFGYEFAYMGSMSSFGSRGMTLSVDDFIF